MVSSSIQSLPTEQRVTKKSHRRAEAIGKIKRKPRFYASSDKQGKISSARERVDMNDLNNLLGFLIRRAQLWVFQDFIKSLSHINIRPADYAVLSVVDANPGLSQMTLAYALGIERAHLVRLLNRLEDRMYLNRISSVSDRRSHSLHLTDRGRNVLTKSRVTIADQERRMAKMVGAEHYQKMKRALLAFCPS
jgi:DNA-binding MarR family transcriptional regulator